MASYPARVAPSARKRVVERYIDGFRAGDHELILSCLTDDIEWVMHPYFQLSGKGAFDEAIENEAALGLPDIQLSRLIEEDDVARVRRVTPTARTGPRLQGPAWDRGNPEPKSSCRS